MTEPKINKGSNKGWDNLKPAVKGEPSRNPNGRPKKGNAWADIINSMVDGSEVKITIINPNGKEKNIEIKVEPKDISIRHAIVYGIIRKAVSGDVSAFNALADRTVGKAGQSIDLKIDDFLLRVEGVNIGKFPKDGRNKH